VNDWSVWTEKKWFVKQFNFTPHPLLFHRMFLCCPFCCRTWFTLRTPRLRDATAISSYATFTSLMRFASGCTLFQLLYSLDWLSSWHCLHSHLLLRSDLYIMTLWFSHTGVFAGYFSLMWKHFSPSDLASDSMDSVGQPCTFGYTKYKVKRIHFAQNWLNTWTRLSEAVIQWREN